MDKLQWGRRKRLRCIKVVKDIDKPFSSEEGVDHIPNEITYETAWRRMIHSCHDEFKPENFLFEERVQSTESGKCSLTVSRETAKKHFFIADTEAGHDKLLVFSDRIVVDWCMVLSIPAIPGTDRFVIKGQKRLFFNANNLKAGDLIRFYKRVPAIHSTHYLVDCINYLFDKELTQIDATSTQLHIPESEEIHFLPEKTGQETCNQVEINGKLRFSDVENESWQMNLTFNETTSALQLAGQWTLFVKKHHLKANDKIIFYEAKKPLDGNRYLIRFEKKGDCGGELTLRILTLKEATKEL